MVSALFPGFLNSVLWFRESVYYHCCTVKKLCEYATLIHWAEIICVVSSLGETMNSSAMSIFSCENMYKVLLNVYLREKSLRHTLAMFYLLETAKLVHAHQQYTKNPHCAAIFPTLDIVIFKVFCMKLYPSVV